MAFPEVYAILRTDTETFYAHDNDEVNKILAKLIYEGKTKDNVHVFILQERLIFDELDGYWRQFQRHSS